MSFADARRAVLSHDAAELRRLLECCAPTSIALGEDLLALAVTNGAQEAVNILLESGAEFADPTLGEIFRNRPSAAAIRCLPDALLQWAPERPGARSLLERALVNRAEDAAVELLRRGALVCSGALDTTVANGVCTESMLDAAPPHALREVSPRTLPLAADRGDWTTVRRLVSAGVSVHEDRAPPSNREWLRMTQAGTVAEQLIIAAAKQSADFDLPDAPSTPFVLRHTVQTPRFPRLLERASDETVRGDPTLLQRAAPEAAALLLDRGAPVSAEALATGDRETMRLVLGRCDCARLPLSEAIELTADDSRRIELIGAGGLPAVWVLRSPNAALVSAAIERFPQLLQPEDPTSGETLVDVLAGLSTLQIALDAGAPMTLSALLHERRTTQDIAAALEQRRRPLRGHELLLMLRTSPEALPGVPGLGAALDEVILGGEASHTALEGVDVGRLLDVGALSLRGLGLVWCVPRDPAVSSPVVRKLARHLARRHVRRIPVSIRPPEELLAPEPDNPVPRRLRRVVEAVRLRCVLLACMCLSRRRSTSTDAVARIGLLPSRARQLVVEFLS